MSVANFLNTNESRTYPFVDLEVGLPVIRSDAVEFQLPNALIVEFTSLVGLDAEWVEDQNAIYLHAITRTGSVFTFDFRSDATGLNGFALRFSRAITDAEFTSEIVEAVDSTNDLPPSSDCGDAFVWEGTLVTGQLDSLVAILADGQSLIAADGAVPVEPALVQSLAKTYVRAINLANYDRTHAQLPNDCTSSIGASTPLVLVNQLCMTGKITLKEGFNCAIQQNNRDNTIKIAAAVGAGAGVPCDEVPLNEADTPPAGSTLLTGGPACSEVVSSINGLSAAAIRLIAGQGVSIAPHPSDVHTLVVEADAHGMLTCPDFTTSSL